MAVDRLHGAVKGTMPLSQLRESWGQLDRHLRDTPRKRTFQNMDELEALSGLPNA